MIQDAEEVKYPRRTGHIGWSTWSSTQCSGSSSPWNAGHWEVARNRTESAENLVCWSLKHGLSNQLYKSARNCFPQKLQPRAWREIFRIFPSTGGWSRSRSAGTGPRWSSRSDVGGPSARNIAARASKQKPKLKFRSRRFQKTRFQVDSSFNSRVMIQDMEDVKISSSNGAPHAEEPGARLQCSGSSCPWNAGHWEVAPQPHRKC